MGTESHFADTSGQTLEAEPESVLIALTSLDQIVERSAFYHGVFRPMRCFIANSGDLTIYCRSPNRLLIRSAAPACLETYKMLKLIRGIVRTIGSTVQVLGEIRQLGFDAIFVYMQDW